MHAPFAAQRTRAGASAGASAGTAHEESPDAAPAPGAKEGFALEGRAPVEGSGESGAAGSPISSGGPPLAEAAHAPPAPPEPRAAAVGVVSGCVSPRMILELTGAEMKVYLALLLIYEEAGHELHEFGDGQGVATRDTLPIGSIERPGLKHMSEKTGLHPSAVSKAKNSLAERGLVEVVAAEKDANEPGDCGLPAQRRSLNGRFGFREGRVNIYGPASAGATVLPQSAEDASAEDWTAKPILSLASDSRTESSQGESSQGESSHYSGSGGGGSGPASAERGDREDTSERSLDERSLDERSSAGDSDGVGDGVRPATRKTRRSAPRTASEKEKTRKKGYREEAKTFYASLAAEDPELSEALCILHAEIPAWPTGLREDERTVERLKNYREQFPEVYPPELCRMYAAWVADNPLKKNSNPRAALRNWFANDRRYGGKASRTAQRVRERETETNRYTDANPSTRKNERGMVVGPSSARPASERVRDIE